MTQAPSPYAKQLPYVVGLLGALAGAAFFYGITMDVAVALILGAPTGLLAGITAYRTVPRTHARQRIPARPAQRPTPAPPTIEEQARPQFRMKIKN